MALSFGGTLHFETNISLMEEENHLPNNLALPETNRLPLKIDAWNTEYYTP